MHVTLRQLRALVAVARTGSFTEAAKSLHLSQAALSGLIKELETQVDMRLLERSTRKVAPSAVGETFIPLAERVLSDLDEALDGLDSLKALRRGLVRVAAPESVSCTFMPQLIAAYREVHPGVEVRFDDIAIERVFLGLHDASVDVGFGPPRAIDEAVIATKVLWSDPLWVAVRPDDELAARDRVRWSDLRERRVYSYLSTFQDIVAEEIPVHDRPAEVVQVHRVNTALSMLHAQPGVAVCPSLVRPIAQGFGLVFLPLDGPTVERDIAVYSRKRESPSPAVASFLAFAIEFSGRWIAAQAPPR